MNPSVVIPIGVCYTFNQNLKRNAVLAFRAYQRCWRDRGKRAACALWPLLRRHKGLSGWSSGGALRHLALLMTQMNKGLKRYFVFVRNVSMKSCANGTRSHCAATAVLLCRLLRRALEDAAQESHFGDAVEVFWRPRRVALDVLTDPVAHAHRNCGSKFLCHSSQ